MKHISRSPKTIFTGSAILLATTTSTFAQQKPFMQSGTAQPPLLPAPPVAAASAASTNAPLANLKQPMEKFFNGQIPDALANGSSISMSACVTSR